MAHAAFDTLEFVDELEKSGIPEKQARAISAAVGKAYNASDIVTKIDLREYESAIHSDLEKLETGLRYEMSDLRKEMSDLRKDMLAMEQRFDARLDKLGLQIVNKLGGLIVAGVVVITALPALIKYLHLN